MVLEAQHGSDFGPDSVAVPAATSDRGVPVGEGPRLPDGWTVTASGKPYELTPLAGYGYVDGTDRDKLIADISEEFGQVVFILWKWANGWRPNSGYDSDKVNAVARMIHANFDLPHRVVCVTDDPAGIDRSVCEPIEMWPRPVINGENWVARPNCFHRLRVFDTEYMMQLIGGGCYYWSMDIDAVILHNFTDLMPTRNYTAVQGRHARYNGSMWAVRPYTNQHVWLDFHPVDSPAAIVAAKHAGKKLVGSDQAHMSLQIPDGGMWPVGERGPIAQYKDHIRGPKVDPGVAIVFFAGSAKPWHFTVKMKCPILYDTFMRYMQ